MLLKTKLSYIALAIFIVGHLIAIPAALINPDYFALHVAEEDGLLETLTAVFLFLAALVLVWRGVQFWRLDQRLNGGLNWLYAFIYAFVAGEEISWGQRIFGWQSDEFFMEHNRQSETNLHNLIVGHTQLANTLFGNWLTIVLLLYLILVPLLYGRLSQVTGLMTALAAPVPRTLHMWMAIAATLAMVVIMGVGRQFELYEFAFSLMSLMIFLQPRNEAMYHAAKQTSGRPRPVAE